jgi:hypothetical protein
MTEESRAARKYERLINQEVLERKMKKGTTLLELIVSSLEFIVDLLSFFGHMSKEKNQRRLRKLERIQTQLLRKKKKGILSPSQRKLLRKVKTTVTAMRDNLDK